MQELSRTGEDSKKFTGTPLMQRSIILLAVDILSDRFTYIEAKETVLGGPPDSRGPQIYIKNGCAITRNALI